MEPLKDLDVIFSFFYSGALVLLTITIFIVLVKSKERIYFYHLLFLLFSLLEATFYLIKRDALPSLSILSHDQEIAISEMFALLAFFAYCLFSTHLFNLKEQRGKLYYLVISTATLTAAYAVFYVFAFSSFESRETAFLYSRLVIFFLAVVILLWILLKANRTSIFNYFMWGSGFYFLGATLGWLRESFATLPFPLFYKIHFETYFQGGILIEVIFFTVALLERLNLRNTLKQQQLSQINTLSIYEKEKAQAEALAIKVQINPHFLFNYLSAVKYYIQINENKKAIDFLVLFSKFLRKILSLNQEAVISLKDELGIIQHYLRLESVRFNQDLTYEVNTYSQIEWDKIRIPSLLLQPFVEEMLWQSSQDFSTPQQHKKYFIDIQKDPSELLITIADNSPFETIMADENAASSQSHLLMDKQMVDERILLFNKIYKKETISYHTLQAKELAAANKRFQTIIKIKYG